MSTAMDIQRRPIIIGIGGLTSEVGKTTLLCELLSYFPGWEAIKTTRGHYRSCGKDPHTCCVSDMLADEVVVHSTRELTDARGKDTGRYWDAGASNVHWVIATDEQVEAGINKALSRVITEGVFVEGNSFTKFVKPDYFVMVARSDRMKMKGTSKEALRLASAFYLSDSTYDAVHKERFAELILKKSHAELITAMPIFLRHEVAKLAGVLQQIKSPRELPGRSSPAATNRGANLFRGN